MSFDAEPISPVIEAMQVADGGQATDTSPARRRRPGQWMLAVCAIASIVVAFLGVRALRSPDAVGIRSSSASPAAEGMPTSDAIENTYGIRFDAVAITAAGGMIEIRYTVLDPAKAAALHNPGTEPFVVAGGKTFDQPGMAGHGHSKATPGAGNGGFTLLANVDAGVHGGDSVSVRVGDLRLDGVVVLG